MEVTIDQFDGKALESRYSKGRTTILAWCQALGIEPAHEGPRRRAIYTLAQVEQLDDLHSFLQGGKFRTISEYLETTITDRSPTLTPGPLLDAPISSPTIPLVVLRVMALRALVEAADLGVLLTTAEIAEAVGRGTAFLTGKQGATARGFHFLGAGFEGRNRVWRVERCQSSHPALEASFDRPACRAE